MFNPDPKKKRKKKRKKSIPKKIVLAVFKRDNYTCQYCPRVYSKHDHALHCHHIVHTSQGGKDTIKNLNSCCWVCHADHGEVSRIDRERIMLGAAKYCAKSFHSVEKTFKEDFHKALKEHIGEICKPILNKQKN